MGAFMSLAGIKGITTPYTEIAHNKTSKRQKMTLTFDSENLRLIPNLPDEISLLILARLPRICYLKVKLVSRKWRETVMDTELFKLRKELKTTEEWLYLLTKFEDDKLLWRALDPLSGKWLKLPPMPNFIYEDDPKCISSGVWMWNMMGHTAKISNMIRGWVGQKYAPDQMPFCGCSIAAVEGCLYVLGGFSRASTMSCVWKYDPILNTWQEVSSMSTARAYCKTGVLNNKLYVIGGVFRGRAGLGPLQSAESFDPCTGLWTQLPSMPFSRAQVLPTAFLADMLKPIATGMTSYRGKLCVPQSLYSWPFFIDVGGEVYDPDTDSWAEMPIGMGEGWPAKQAGTKLSIVVDDELYAFDPSSSLDSGSIKIYDQTEDAWKVVIGKVPICDFIDSETPYLLAGVNGKLHVVTKDASQSLLVLQAEPLDNLHNVSSSSNGVLDGFSRECSYLEAASDTVVWKVISKRDFASSELVSCQVLDL